ncbi:hypothetical protein ACHAWF_002242 [Thalassiosira exigua]
MTLPVHDVLVVGGGVVGLSILRSCLLAGHTARNPNLCDGASGRNSGVICTGVDAPRGSLERALIRDSIGGIRGFCEEHNVPARECGSLVCAWPWDDDDDEDGGEGEEGEDEKKIDDACDDVGSGGREESRDSTRVAAAKLELVLAESRDAGDAAARLSPEEVAKLEPSLSPECRGVVHIEGEVVVDPWLFCLALAAHCRELAAEAGGGEGGEEEGDALRLGREALLDRWRFDAAAGVWSVATRERRSERTDPFAYDPARADALHEGRLRVFHPVRPAGRGSHGAGSDVEDGRPPRSNGGAGAGLPRFESARIRVGRVGSRGGVRGDTPRNVEERLSRRGAPGVEVRDGGKDTQHGADGEPRDRAARRAEPPARRGASSAERSIGTAGTTCASDAPPGRAGAGGAISTTGRRDGRGGRARLQSDPPADEDGVGRGDGVGVAAYLVGDRGLR